MPRGAPRRALALVSAGLVVAGVALVPTAASAGDWPNSVVASVPLPWALDVAFDPAGATAFVVREGADVVDVVDVASRTVLPPAIPVGDTGLGTQIAMSPNGDVALVSNVDGGTVSVIDAQLRVVIETLVVGGSPTGIAFSPDGSTAYVGNGGDGTDGSVSVIDVGSWATTTLPVGGSPQLLAVSPDGTELWVPGDANGGVTVFDTANLDAVASIPMPQAATVVAFAPDGSAAFVGMGQGGDGEVVRVDTATRTATASSAGIPLGGWLFAELVVTPDGETVFAVTTEAGLAVLEASTLAAVTQTLDGDLRPGAALTPDGGELWVANEGTSSVEIYAFEGPRITTTTLPDGVGGKSYGPATLSAVNPSTLPVSFSSSDLPSWLTLDAASGSLTGTPPPTGASYSFTVVVTDAAGHSGTAPFSVLIHDPAEVQSLAITPSASRVLQGSTISLAVAARLDGGATVPLSSGVTFSSDVATDVVVGSTVTFRHASTHTVTARWEGFAASVAIVVIPVIAGEVQWPDTVVGTLRAGVGYSDVAVSPDSATAYATGDALDVIDTATGTVRASVAISGAGGVDVGADGSLVAVTSTFSGASSAIVLVDTATLATTSVPTTGNLEDVAFSPDGSTVVAVGQSVWIVDLAAPGSPRELPITGDSVAITPDGAAAWISSSSGMYAIDLATGAAVPIDASTPSEIAFTPDGATALACDTPHSLAFFDVATRTVKRSIPLVGPAVGCVMWVKPGGLEAYVIAPPAHANQGGEGVTVAFTVDIASATILKTIPNTGFATGLALAPDGSIGYISQLGDGGLTVLAYGGPDPLAPDGDLAATGAALSPAAPTGLGLALIAAGLLVGALARRVRARSATRPSSERALRNA
ncbi:putative Ig domain-containing protein [Protaetiibacter sp. SSC-01]|uniref:putative Ig domain-containing protein n=1 Tax=Protaetiibacter sp. SSC-01 TaxID=2759943 RepID=UPI0016573FEF|nr:putative Ig domain-containing protein [Protaetiibacter sp. SSC-01]QNO37419.1 putative Ig domain-containing protein [Protaetiibacter sp. SSC-01]